MKTIFTIGGFFLAAAAALCQERFPAIPSERMTASQTRVAGAIVAGPRKGLSGPFHAWLRSPELADRLQRVGEYLRFSSSLPPRLNEFAILITARHWTAQYEWYAHHALAMKAGLGPKVAADLAAGLRPRGMQEDETVVYEFSTQLHRDKSVSDAVFQAALAKFGEQGTMDLIAVNGYYDIVSMTLNVAQVGLPAGEKLPLKTLGK